MGLHNKNNNRGFTFIEIMLVLVVLMASITGVYLMLKPASLKAGIEKEQRNLANVVSEVQGAFGRTQGTYEGLRVEKIQELRPEGLKFDLQPNTDGFQEAKIVSKFNDSMSLRPAEVKRPNDAFDIVYEGLNEKKCYGFIKTFYPQSYGIYVGESEQPVQETVGLNEGRLAPDTTLFAACGTADFKANQGTVVFRFYEPMAFSATVTDAACGCTPETQTQDLPCGPSQSGVITQERTNDCTGGTAACPQPNWSGWNTTGNTCTGNAVPMAPTTSVDPAPTACIPGQLFQNLSCAATETGQITQRRDVTCPTPTGAPVMGAWITVQNTCATPSTINATCSTGVNTRSTACPLPQIGSITERRTATCSDPFAAPVYGSWVEVSRSCRMACAEGNSCCQPLPDQNRPLSCPAGFWGTGTEERNSWCVAASPETPRAWSAWYITAGGCTACPAPSTATETRWTAQGGATCPAGQYGSNTWEREEQRSRTTTYNCPAGTPVEPPPTIAPWTGWTPTGTTRNPSNTCTSCPANTSTPETRWVNDGQACPVGQVGSHTWQSQETRTQNTTYSCPAGTATAPTPTVTWTPWTPTGARQNEVNTCAVPVCTEDGQPYQQWVQVSQACGPGFTGSQDWEKEQTRTRACSSPPAWDAWSAWTDVVGSTRNFHNNCVPISTCSTTTNYVRHTVLASDAVLNPAGQTTSCGDLNTWQSTCSAGQTCHVEKRPGSAAAGWNTWMEYDAVCTGSCAAPPPGDCTVASGTTFNWTVSGENCTYTTSGPNVVGNGASYTANDVTPAPIGVANFLCTAGTISMSAQPGATCAVGCVAPATTNTTVYRPAAVETRTVACPPGFTGSISQERTRDEIGNENTTWSCPGPTPTPTTTWSGTYTNLGAWITVQNTCAAPSRHGYRWKKILGGAGHKFFIGNGSPAGPMSTLHPAYLPPEADAAFTTNIRNAESAIVPYAWDAVTPAPPGSTGAVISYRSSANSYRPPCDAARLGQVVLIQKARDCFSNFMGGCANDVFEVWPEYYMCVYEPMPAPPKGWLLRDKTEANKPSAVLPINPAFIRITSTDGFNQSWSGAAAEPGLNPVFWDVLSTSGPLPCTAARHGVEVTLEVRNLASDPYSQMNKTLIYVCNYNDTPYTFDAYSFGFPSSNPAACTGPTAYATVSCNGPGGTINVTKNLYSGTYPATGFSGDQGFWWTQATPVGAVGNFSAPSAGSSSSALSDALEDSPACSCTAANVGTTKTTSVCQANTLTTSTVTCGHYVNLTSPFRDGIEFPYGNGLSMTEGPYVDNTSVVSTYLDPQPNYLP